MDIGPLQSWIISPTQQFHFSQSPCTPSSKRQSFAELSLLWEAQPAGLARVERPGHDPTTGLFPLPSGLSNPLDRHVRQGWGVGGCKPLQGWTFHEPGKEGGGKTEQSQQEQAREEARLLGKPLWLSKYWAASSPRWGLKWSCQARVNWRELWASEEQRAHALSASLLPRFPSRQKGLQDSEMSGPRPVILRAWRKWTRQGIGCCWGNYFNFNSF